MKKLISIVTLLMLLLSTMVFGAEGKLQSGADEEFAGDNDFYITNIENKVFWGGGFTVSDKLADDIYSLLIAIYDSERLVSLDTIKLDQNLESFIFDEQCVRLSYVPKSLSAKAMAMDSKGNLKPLAEAVSAINVKPNTSYGVGKIVWLDTETKEVEIERMGLASFQIFKILLHGSGDFFPFLGVDGLGSVEFVCHD